MIIETRYRDIPWEEASACLTPKGRQTQDGAQWEARGRGRPVTVMTPPIVLPEPQYFVACKGPHYRIIDPVHPKPGQVKTACVHIAEIGD